MLDYPVIRLIVYLDSNNWHHAIYSAPSHIKGGSSGQPAACCASSLVFNRDLPRVCSCTYVPGLQLLLT